MEDGLENYYSDSSEEDENFVRYVSSYSNDGRYRENTVIQQIKKKQAGIEEEDEDGKTVKLLNDGIKYLKQQSSIHTINDGPSEFISEHLSESDEDGKD